MKFKLYLFITAGFIIIYVTYCFIIDEYIEYGFHGGVPILGRVDSCPEKMVYQINSMGQLGNQMMDYGTVYVAAREMPGYVGMLDNSREFLTKHFSHIELQDISPKCRRIKERENAMNFNTGVAFKELYYSGSADATTIDNFSRAHANVAFTSYDWLPILYPKYIKELKREFTFKDTILEEALLTLKLLKALYLDARKPLLFVGVHIRRGDYKHHLKVLYNMNLLEPSFYITGMDYFIHKYSQTNQVIFAAVSNDVTWVSENLKYPHFHIVSKSAAVDMALLSHCNHTITDYGTFGFLPSLLHGGEHYTTNVYEDFIVDMMYRVKGWTVVNITTPLASDHHPRGWLNREEKERVT